MKKVILLLLAGGLLPPVGAATRQLGGGFAEHGVCAPVSIARGVTAARGGQGEDLLIAQLIDLRGAYGVVRLNFATGACDFAPVPFEPSFKNAVFAAMYGSNNRFYCHHSDHFSEYDPVSGEYSFYGKTHPGMGMSMTEDDRGVIWAVTFPDCGVVSFDPGTRKLTDFGAVCREDFLQYARSVAADDRGFIYFGYGNAKPQIVIFNPVTREATTVIPEAERRGPGAGLVCRADNGKVYAVVGAAPHYSSSMELWEKSPGREGQYYELYDGKFVRLDRKPEVTIKPIHTGTQDFVNPAFPGGRKITELNILERRIKSVAPDAAEEKVYPLEYPSAGAHLICLLGAADGKITGGTAFPMSNFVYDPAADTMLHRHGAVQWNAMARSGDHIFIGAYNGGYLLDWDWTKPYRMPLQADDAKDNPRLTGPRAAPHIGRPHALAISPDGRYVLMGGTPGYGLTGGGLMICDRQSGRTEVIPHMELIPDHSIHTLVITPYNGVLGGTRINPGTGGVVKAVRPVFFEFDLETRKIVWQRELFDRGRTYIDLALAPDGAIVGVMDGNRLFRFDPATREMTATATTGRFGDVSSQQGARSLLREGDELYLLGRDYILKLDPRDCSLEEVAKSPVKIENAGDIVNRRLYFGSHGKLYSYQLR